MSALIVVSGPSGVGKNTVLRKVLSTIPQLVVGTSWTTRGPREDDEAGIKIYRYVSREEFMTAIGRGEFLEWAEFAGNLYGTIAPADDQVTLLEIEVLGAQQVWMNRTDAIMIGLLPPGSDLEAMYDCCEGRLRGRKTDSEEKIASRLLVTRGELAVILERWPHKIINTDSDEAAEQICRIIYQLTRIGMD